MGAVKLREGLPTTPPSPRYTVAAGFARLLDSSLTDQALLAEIEAWPAENLSRSALARDDRPANEFGITNSKGVLVFVGNR